MGKGKHCKWLIPLSLGFVLLSGGHLVRDNSIVNADSGVTINPIVLSASHTLVTISDSALNTAVRALLGKSSTANLYADDFLTNANYKPTTTTDSTTGVSTTTANTYQLDLSNTGVTDIRELCKFAFPSTLQGINLAGNGITNEDLESITTFLNSTESSSIVIGDNTYTCQSDYSSIIKKVNLNNNNIDLEETSSTYLNNQKLLFGIQNFGEIHSSGLVRQGEIEPMYYIREDDGTGTITSDANYLSFSFIFEYSIEENSVIKKVYNTPTKLLDFSKMDRQNGKVSITVASLENTSSAYFSGYEFSREFYLFDISIDESFTVERESLLNLNIIDGKPADGCPLNVDGFGNSLIISYNSPSTSYATTKDYTNNVMITLTYGSRTRTVSVEFVVVDTIAPVIKLKGGSHIYSSQNKKFTDPGYTAYDPASIGAETGYDLSNMVVRTGTVQINNLGEYTLTYTVSDLVGNTTSVTRIVDIQESVLDTINLRTNTSDLLAGEDIILVIQPDSGVDVTKYSNLTYYWYLNGNLFITTKGDSITGKSTTTINISNSGVNEISVRLTALQTADNVEIEVYSETLELVIEPQLRNNDTLFLASAVALVSILIIVGIVALVRYQKGKGSTHKKHKNFIKGKKRKKIESNPNQPQIQVIKDYNEADFKSTNSSIFNEENNKNSDNNSAQNSSQNLTQNNAQNNPFSNLNNNIKNTTNSNQNNNPFNQPFNNNNNGDKK